jgi:valyl-tRNA synthetase
VRSEVNVAPSVTTPLLVRDAAPESLARAARWIDAIRRLGRVTEIVPLVGEPPRGVAQVVVGEATVMLPLEGVIDIPAERSRLTKARGTAEGEIRKVEAKLGNPDFIARAKEEVVEENRERLASFQAEIARLDAALARIAA